MNFSRFCLALDIFQKDYEFDIRVNIKKFSRGSVLDARNEKDYNLSNTEKEIETEHSELIIFFIIAL